MKNQKRMQDEYATLDLEQRRIYQYAKQHFRELINPEDNESLLAEELKTVESFEIYLHIASMKAAKAGFYKDKI